MRMAAPPDVPTDPPVPPKLRLCLRCQEAFSSTWAGERICSRCKHKSAWRSGMPASSQRIGRGR